MSRWNSTKQLEYSASWDAKQTFIYLKQYTILFLELILFMPTSYGVKTTKSTEKVVFKKQYESADPLYKNLKIFQLQNLLRLKNYMFMCQLEQNKKLAVTFSRLVYTKEKHNYDTRSARKNLLDKSLCQTFTYEMQSCKYQCIEDWNRFKNENSTENLTYPAVNNIVKKNILVSY